MISSATKTMSESGNKRYFIGLFLIWLIYSGLTIWAPAAEAVNRYGLTVTQTNFLRLTICFPLLFIWMTAIFAIVRFRRYTDQIQGSEEAPGFDSITKGLWMLFLVLVLPNFVNVIAAFWPGSFVAHQVSTIVRNYLTIAFYLAAFWYIWHASKQLLATVQGQFWAQKFHLTIVVSLVVLTFLYAWAIFQNPFRTMSVDSLVLPTYFLPDWLIILTIIVPYAFIWMLGSLAILNIWSYAKIVPGVIYRRTFSNVAFGLTFTIVLLIGLQFMSQANAALGHSALQIILVIIYVILLAVAVGYLLVARGAKQLSVIEEVE